MRLAFDTDFTPKGPELVRQRMEDLRRRLGSGEGDPQDFRATLQGLGAEQVGTGHSRASQPAPLRGRITKLGAQLQGGATHVDGARPLDPLAAGLRAPSGRAPEFEIRRLISTVSKEQRIDPRLLTAVVEAESGFNPLEISKKGAQGLMQLMPETARSLGVNDPFDAYQNLSGGARYLNQMLTRYHGDLPKALAAYNAGPGNVDRAGGIPPFPETQNYVRKIMNRIGEARIGGGR